MPRFMLTGAASLAVLAFAACGEKAEILTNQLPASPDLTATPAADHDAAVRAGQDFVNAAAQASMVEIRTSEIALTKTKNSDIKQFAQMMIDDHRALGDALRAAASAAALAPPSQTLDDFHMRRINDITETDGARDFDADYMNMQVDAHNDAIKMFGEYAKGANVMTQLKDLADKTMPRLVVHMAEAERVRDLVNKTENKNPS